MADFLPLALKLVSSQAFLKIIVSCTMHYTNSNMLLAWNTMSLLISIVPLSTTGDSNLYLLLCAFIIIIIIVIIIINLYYYYYFLTSLDTIKCTYFIASTGRLKLITNNFWKYFILGKKQLKTNPPADLQCKKHITTTVYQ